jgi:hypothetical protein
MASRNIVKRFPLKPVNTNHEHKTANAIIAFAVLLFAASLASLSFANTPSHHFSSTTYAIASTAQGALAARNEVENNYLSAQRHVSRAYELSGCVNEPDPSSCRKEINDRYAREWNSNLNEGVTNGSVSDQLELLSIRNDLQRLLDAGCSPPKPCADPQYVQDSITSLNNLLEGHANMADYNRIVELVGIGTSAALLAGPAYTLGRGIVGEAGTLLSQLLRREAVEAGMAANAQRVANLGIPSEINVAAQARHINPIDGRSTLTANPNELLRGLVNGEFSIIRQNRPGTVLVDFGKPIGTFSNNRVPVGPSRYGWVSYGRDGVHIYPANPVQW